MNFRTCQSFARLVVLAAAAPLCTACVTESGSGRVLKESPDDAAAYNYQLGVEYLRNGKLRQARERLESSVRQNPDVAQTHVTLAILYQRIDEPDLADRSYRNAMRVAPDEASVQNSYAVYLCGKRRFDQAERYFVRAARNPLYSTPAAALTNAGVCMRSKPDLDAAERYFREALDIDESFADALIQLADLQMKTGNLLSARAFMQRLLAAREPTAESLLLGWRIEKALGDDDAAAEYADMLVERYPESREANRLKGG